MKVNIIYFGTLSQQNGDTGSRTLKRENPHKYLLYKPTFSQLMVFLASGFKELPANGAMLLYISADGAFSTSKHPQDRKCIDILFLWFRCLNMETSGHMILINQKKYGYVV